MSLPSKAVFVKNGEIVHASFVNCGWFDDEPSVERCLVEMHDEHKYPPADESWEHVELYGRSYHQDEVMIIVIDARIERLKKMRTAAAERIQERRKGK